MSLAQAAARWLARNPERELALHCKEQRGLAEAAPLFIGVAPTLRNAPPPDELEQMQRIAQRFDAAGRDERNRLLGYAGEERALHHERATLSQYGRNDLAERVRWLSKTVMGWATTLPVSHLRDMRPNRSQDNQRMGTHAFSYLPQRTGGRRGKAGAVALATCL